MQLNIPPDLETLINKRISSGAYMDAEDVLRRALEAQDAEENWTDGAQARREIQSMKEDWHGGRLPGQ
jgi:Arc/MetJ-type ribon-helix-helix transcriptional regulator